MLPARTESDLDGGAEMTVDAGLAAFVRGLPKAELHLHIAPDTQRQAWLAELDAFSGSAQSRPIGSFRWQVMAYCGCRESERGRS